MLALLEADLAPNAGQMPGHFVVAPQAAHVEDDAVETGERQGGDRLGLAGFHGRFSVKVALLDTTQSALILQPPLGGPKANPWQSKPALHEAEGWAGIRRTAWEKRTFWAGSDAKFLMRPGKRS